MKRHAAMTGRGLAFRRAPTTSLDHVPLFLFEPWGFMPRRFRPGKTRSAERETRDMISRSRSGGRSLDGPWSLNDQDLVLSTYEGVNGA